MSPIQRLSYRGLAAHNKHGAAVNLLIRVISLMINLMLTNARCITPTNTDRTRILCGLCWYNLCHMRATARVAFSSLRQK